MSKYKEQYMKERRRIQRFIKSAEKRGYDFGGYEPPKIPKRITAASIRRLQAITSDNLYGKATYHGEASLGEQVSGRRGRELERSRAAKKGLVRKRIKEAAKRVSDAVHGLAVKVKGMVKLPKERREAIWEQGTPQPKLPDGMGGIYDLNDPDFVPPKALPQQGNEGRIADTQIANYKYYLKQFNQRFEHLMLKWLEEVILKYGNIETARMLEEAANNGVIITWKTAYNESERLNYITEVMKFLPDLDDRTRQDIWDAAQDDESWFDEA